MDNNSVCRRLFPSQDDDEKTTPAGAANVLNQARRDRERELEEYRAKYNFDFRNDKPLEGRFEWRRMSETPSPETVEEYKPLFSVFQVVGAVSRGVGLCETTDRSIQTELSPTLPRTENHVEHFPARLSDKSPSRSPVAKSQRISKSESDTPLSEITQRHHSATSHRSPQLQRSHSHSPVQVRRRGIKDFFPIMKRSNSFDAGSVETAAKKAREDLPLINVSLPLGNR